jgi:hypothetical protein
MSEMPTTRIAIQDELQRIEEDCIHSGKAKFNAGMRWSRYHLFLGVSAVILSALAGTASTWSGNGDNWRAVVRPLNGTGMAGFGTSGHSRALLGTT